MTCECGEPATALIRTHRETEECCARCAALDGHGRLEAEIIRNLIDGPHTTQHLIELVGADKAFVLRTLKKLIERGRVRKIKSDEYHSVDCIATDPRGARVEATRFPEVSIYLLANPTKEIPC